VLFKSARSRRPIAILTPKAGANCSPLDPFGGDTNGRKWTYYHRCLEERGGVRYLEPGDWESVRGYQYAFVHEALYDVLGERTIAALQTLKRNNGRVIWVELHEKSIFSGACFLPGFFAAVDRVLKHQLVDWDFLKSELRKPVNRLAPHVIYGKPSYLEFLADPHLFAFRVEPQLFEDHLRFDFAEVQDKIVPIMYPFSWSLLARGLPAYSCDNAKAAIATYSGRLSLNHLQRNALVAAVTARGVPATFDADYLASLRSSRHFLALGHIHSSLRTFDTLAFDTVLVHYEPGPYKWWSEFQPYRNFIPIGDVSKIFRAGGFGMDEAYVDSIAEQLKADLQNEELRAIVLEGQRALFEKLIDPSFIRGKLGMDE